MTLLKARLVGLLRKSERYTKTDLVYLTRSGIQLTGADAVTSLLSLGVAILIAAYVPKETFGIYRYLLSIAALAVAVSLTGMNTAITRAVALGRDGAVRASLKPQCQFAVLQALLIAVCAAYYFFRGNEVYGVALVVIALLAPLAGVFNTYSAYLNGKAEFGKMAWFKIQSGVINAVAMAAVVLASPTVLALTISYFLSTFALNLWFLRKTLARIPHDAPCDPADLSYGKHLSVMNSLGMASTQLDALLLYHLLGPVALALYSFAILIPERMRSLFAFFPNVALPKLSNRTPEEIRSTLYTRLGFITAAALVLAGMYALVTPYVFAWFFPAYLDAVAYSQLAGLFVITALGGYLSAAMTALRQQRELYAASLITLIAKVIMSIVGILFFGIMGAIAARVIAAGINAAVSLFYLRTT